MTYQLINLERIKFLPVEIQNMIFYYIPRSGTARVIKYVIDVYNIDHCRSLTKMYKMYYVKNIISFINYVQDSRFNSDDYDYGHLYYDEVELIENY